MLLIFFTKYQEPGKSEAYVIYVLPTNYVSSIISLAYTKSRTKTWIPGKARIEA